MYDEDQLLTDTFEFFLEDTTTPTTEKFVYRLRSSLELDPVECCVEDLEDIYETRRMYDMVQTMEVVSVNDPRFNEDLTFCLIDGWSLQHKLAD